MGLYYRTIVNPNTELWFKPDSEFIDCDLLCRIDKSSELETKRINQDDIFNDLYLLGNNIYNAITKPHTINIENWYSTRFVTYERKKYGSQFVLSKMLYNYINSILINKEHSDKMAKMLIDFINKYGVIITTDKFNKYINLSYEIKESVPEYKCDLKQIMFYALLVYDLKCILDSIRSNTKLQSTKLFYIGFNSHTIFNYIKDIIKQYFCFSAIIEIDDETNYIFDNYCMGAGLKLYAITKEMNYNVEKENPTTYHCIKCNHFFVRLGREKICPECKKKDVYVRQRRCREKRRLKGVN